MVEGNPVVIDTRKEFGTGTKNWNYNKPLKVQPRKTLGGIVKIEGKYHKMNLVLSDDDVEKDILLGKVCEFRATKGKISENGTMNFYLENGSDLTFKKEDVDLLAIAKIKTYYPATTIFCQ